MTAGVLLYARIPATSAAWNLQPGSPGSVLPPTSFLTDLLPPAVLFGLGFAILGAPLTTAVMSSVPVANAGLASSINNAVARIGPQLAGALIFVAVTAIFYTSLASRVGADVTSQSLRDAVSPLNAPAASAPASIRAQARYASADAFHGAMLISAGLIVAGAAVNALGVPKKRPGGPVGEPVMAATIQKT
jgi:hypothetical protein